MTSLPFMKLMILNFCGHLSNKLFIVQSNYLPLHNPKASRVLYGLILKSAPTYNVHQLCSLKKKLKRSNSPIISEKVTSAELTLQKQMIEPKSRYESNLVTNFALSNNSKIYSYIKSFSKYSDLCPLIQFKLLILLIKQLYLIVSSTLYSTISLQLLLLRTCMCLKTTLYYCIF